MNDQLLNLYNSKWDDLCSAMQPILADNTLELKPEAEDVRNRQAQYPENAPPQIRSPADSIVANHVIIGRPGLYAKEETRSKGLKI